MTDPRYVLCEDLRSQLAEARRRIAELEADQANWRKGVELIASALGEFHPSDLCCVRISESALKTRADAEQLAEALSLIDELAEELAAHYPDPSQWSDCDSGLMMLAKVEAYRKDR